MYEVDIVYTVYVFNENKMFVNICECKENVFLGDSQDGKFSEDIIYVVFYSTLYNILDTSLVADGVASILGRCLVLFWNL